MFEGGRLGQAAALAIVLIALCGGTAHADVPLFGVNTGQAMRQDVVDVNADQFYGRLTGMGGNVLREDVIWSQVEPNNDQWNWSYLDAEINPETEADSGVGVILMFFNSPQWARDPLAHLITCGATNAASCRMPPAASNLPEWKEFVKETVVRYEEDVVAVEVWNEPNLKSFWRPNGNEPARWAGLVQAAAEATAEVDPAIPVITGGLGNGTTSDTNVGMMQGPYLDAAFASNPNLAQHVDGIGIHPYPGQVPLTNPNNRFTPTLNEIRPVRDARDPGTPLWATEVGYHTGTETTPELNAQRDVLKQIYNELDAAPDIEAMIVHALYDPLWNTSNEGERSFGLVYGTSPFAAKPAWDEFQQMLNP